MNEIDLNNIAVIPLTNSFDFAIIDKKDEQKVRKFKWCLARGQVYSTSKITNSSWYLSRLITGKRRMDHINRNKLDCRNSNFREATESQNCANKDKYLKNTMSQYKNVYYKKDRCKWYGQVCRTENGRKIKYTTRMCNTEKEAATEVNELLIKLFGEFAVLNHIE